MTRSSAYLDRCCAAIASTLVADGCGAPPPKSPAAAPASSAAAPAIIADVETPSAAKVEELVGRCSHAVAPKPDCAELKNKAIQVCNEHQANPCMETLIKFQASECDPKITTEMKDETVEYACSLGSWTSCAWLSARLFQSGDEEKRKRALEVAQQACVHGEAEGCVNLSSMVAWWNGRGSPRQEDLATAMAWSNKGCKLGSKSGCKDYALELLQRKQPSDVAEARKLLEELCAKHFEPACVTLAHEEERGAFGAPNVERATSLWRNACACGEMEGCHGIAHIFYDRSDKRSALAIIKHACANYSFEACWSLGKLYLDGTWVQRDRAQARQYFERACRENEWKSCEALKKMDSK